MNGYPKGFFKSRRGLRKGDPLSPYLFIMAVDFLGRMTSNAEFVGLLEGLFPHVGGGGAPRFLLFNLQMIPYSF